MARKSWRERKRWHGAPPSADANPEEALLLTRMSDRVIGATIAGEMAGSEYVGDVEDSALPLGLLGLAKWYTWAGDHDSALRVMERMVAIRNSQAIWMTMPYFDPLRTEPRYRALLAEMGIPQPS